MLCVDWAAAQPIRLSCPRSLGRGFNQLRNGFWLLRQAKVIYGGSLQFSELVPKHDIELVRPILVHFRDPLGAIYQSSLAANE